MKKNCLFIFLLIHALGFSFAITEEYQRAIDNAKAFKKPMVLLFVGSDWSHESRKLLTLIKEPQSQEVIKNDMILCEIDFPELGRQTEAQLDTNKALKEKYHISQLPSVVLLDHEQEYVTTIGFVPVSPDTFARHIKEMYRIYATVERATASLPELNDSALEKLLVDAKVLQNERLLSVIIEEGISREGNGVFALEKYAQLMAAGKGKSSEAIALQQMIQSKKEALSIDTRLQSAMLAFETAKKEGKLQEALGPLEKVLKEVPPEHAQLWRIHFLVAKYLQEENVKEKASEYAKEAKKNAPKAFHKQLDSLISETETHAQEARSEKM